MVGFPSCHRDLAVHQQGKEPVAELGELLVFLLKHILAFEDGCDRIGFVAQTRSEPR